jgi:5'-nucleotidase
MVRFGALSIILAASVLASCGNIESTQPVLEGKDVRVTFLHTTDIHSRLLPYHMQVMQTDKNLGLAAANGPFGGAARIASVVRDARAGADRSLYLDSGDVSQGAPIYNVFLGEAEFRFLSELGLDVMAAGNHDFDSGAPNLADKVGRFASFPVLAANYKFNPSGTTIMPPLSDLVSPFEIFNLKGLRVGVVGLANISTLSTIIEAGNSMGIVPLESATTTQYYIDMIRPMVDVVIVLTHLGLNDDQKLIACTSGADIVFGGHHHVVLNPPKVMDDAEPECLTRPMRTECVAGVRKALADYVVTAAEATSICSGDLIVESRRMPWKPGSRPADDVIAARCAAALPFQAVLTAEEAADPQLRIAAVLRAATDQCDVMANSLQYTPPERRPVILVHSGAFAKYVGRLDVVFRQIAQGSNDWDVASFKYDPIPIDSTVKADERMAEIMEDYRETLAQAIQLDLILGFAPTDAARFGSGGGDSPLGNLVAESMRKRKGVETDFAVTNSLGIRSDISAGPVTIEQMYQVFPFENTITTMFLSGREVIDVFDYIARRSSSRGCQAQAQIAGARVVLQCGGCNQAKRPAGWPSLPADVIGCAQKIQFFTSDGSMKDVELNGQYQLAANDYIAKGGSGFMMLKRNTTQINTGIPQRDALMDTMRGGLPCGVDAQGLMKACTADQDCPSDYVCGCEDRAEWNAETGTCDMGQGCGTAPGLCVLAACVNGVADRFYTSDCGGDPAANQPLDRCHCDQLARAYASCASVACIDKTNGIIEDGRIQLVRD